MCVYPRRMGTLKRKKGRVLLWCSPVIFLPQHYYFNIPSPTKYVQILAQVCAHTLPFMCTYPEVAVREGFSPCGCTMRFRWPCGSWQRWFLRGIDFENLIGRAEFNLVASRSAQAATLKAKSPNCSLLTNDK